MVGIQAQCAEAILAGGRLFHDCLLISVIIAALPGSPLDALVYFHGDDTAKAQKTDFDGGKIYFWARELCRPDDPTKKWGLAHAPPSNRAAPGSAQLLYFG